eukprot:11683-Heterococcus_DN1.PRE.4
MLHELAQLYTSAVCTTRYALTTDDCRHAIQQGTVKSSIVKCMRCANAYHDTCLRDIIFLRKGKHIVCDQHELDASELAMREAWRWSLSDTSQAVQLYASSTQRKRRIAALGDSEARSKAKLAAAAAANIPPDAQFASDSPEAQSPPTECALCRGTADSEQGVCGPFVRPPLVEKTSKGEALLNGAQFDALLTALGSASEPCTVSTCSTSPLLLLLSLLLLLLYLHSPECYVTLREGQDLADSGAPAAAFSAAELEGAHWYNAVKAKKRGKNIKCAGCGKLGATVGCYTAACKKSYHYPCAVATGWEFGDVPDSHGKVFSTRSGDSSSGGRNTTSKCYLRCDSAANRAIDVET